MTLIGNSPDVKPPFLLRQHNALRRAYPEIFTDIGAPDGELALDVTRLRKAVGAEQAAIIERRLDEEAREFHAWKELRDNPAKILRISAIRQRPIVVRRNHARQARRPSVARVSRPSSRSTADPDPDGEPPRSSHLRLVTKTEQPRPKLLPDHPRLSVMLIANNAGSPLGRSGPFRLSESDFHRLCSVARDLQNRRGAR